MATAVIGAGSIGKTLAGLLSKAGEPVVIAATRVPTDIAHQLGGSVTAATVADAIDQSEAVVFAVWLDVMDQLITTHSSRLQGKVVIDPSNPVRYDSGGTVTRTLPDGLSSGSVVADLLPPSAHFVKAFGTLAAASLASGAGRTPNRAVLFYATDDGVALDRLRPLREHVAGLADITLVGEFIDTASADDLRGRREWRRLLDLAIKRKVDLIVVWKLDRAFRSVVDGATTLQTLRSCGCGIRSMQEPWIDTTTPIGEAMYHITLAWAQLEKKQLTERVKAGMDRARAEGTPIGRPRRARPIMDHPQWPTVLLAHRGLAARPRS